MSDNPNYTIMLWITPEHAADSAHMNGLLLQYPNCKGYLLNLHEKFEINNVLLLHIYETPQARIMVKLPQNDIAAAEYKLNKILYLNAHANLIGGISGLHCDDFVKDQFSAILYFTF